HPWARLWQHHDNVASIAITRQFQNEPAVFFARLRQPQNLSLSEIDQFIDTYTTAPLESIRSYRRLLRSARWPRIVRRAAWSIGLTWSGTLREKHFGTFGVSVYSSTGADSIHPISPLTTLLNYGPIAPDGTMTVRLVYDHRVMDGLEIALALQQLEETLLGSIVKELRTHAAEPTPKAA
ncbi:MAG: hypothetical protein ACRCZF_10485, partial [Gemmataceae bacterium]